MEELQLLVQTVAGLPTLTLWVLAGYLIYKLAVISSIYATIRYLADKFVYWMTAPNKFSFDGITINEDVASQLKTQLSRISTTTYIHSSDVIKLKNAIDNMKQEAK